jgi:molybdopterin-guanine dinucleotide biosynthesis protein A
MAGRATVRGVVLAGGESRRFDGGDKALADLGGRPLLAHVVGAVDAATDRPPLLAVASHEDGDRLTRALSDDGDSVEVVVDDPSLTGPLAGLVVAAGQADRPWLLVCGCDMPLVSPTTFGTLRDYAGPDVDAVVPVVDGHDQPLHALYRREAVIAGAAGLNGRGPRALLEGFENVRRVPATDTGAPLATAVTNVNTREDLEEVRERYGTANDDNQ